MLQVTKYNYSAEEKLHLIEIIAMIKSVQEVLLKLEEKFNEAIVKHVYAELQDFVQVQLREPLRKGIKQKKEIIKMYVSCCFCSCLQYL